MVNITIYPYGNANEKQHGEEWTFDCQHGDAECDGNMVETCFINLVDFDQNKYIDFIISFETALIKNHRNPYKTAQSLIQNGTNSYPVSWDDLSACIGSDGTQGGTTGNAYEHQMALWTAEANHEYTPWITVNGNHNKLIQNECQSDTLKCTCKEYKGSNSCCSKYKKETLDVCWKDEKKDKKH